MSHPRFSLLQARDPGELTRTEEHAAFADKLHVPADFIVPFDMLATAPTLSSITDGYDAVLVGGSGRYGIRDDAPWLAPFIDVLGELASADFPTFASCFGFQGLVMALGGDVQSVTTSSEVGTFPLCTTASASDDPVFGKIPGSFHAQMGHKDSATRFPTEAVHLASSTRCTYQALRVGRNVYATQFHPELSMDDNRLRYERYYAEYKDAFGASKAEAILDSFQPSEASSKLLLDFKRVILG